jgi:outer membrane autotransporter protein
VFLLFFPLSRCGNFQLDDWKVLPAVSVVYFEEEQDSYTAESGLSVPEQVVTMGRLSFGPRATRTFHLGDELELTPEVRLRGTWDFDQAQYVNTDSGVGGTSEQLRARLDGGLTARVSDKQRLIVDGYYDGIGVSGYSAYGVKFGMKVMLE